MGAEASDLVIVYKAESIIQREAVLSALREKGVEAVDAPRDISRKVADGTVDLALEGYSAMFDGFAILVPRTNQAQAEAVIRELLISVQGQPESPATETHKHLRRFYFCSLFSFTLPAVLHVLGFYHLVRAWQADEKPQPVIFMLISSVYMATLMVTFVLARVIFYD